MWVQRYVGGQASAVILGGFLSALLLAGGQAQASGFFLQQQSPAASGRAFAGDAAAAEDASTIFYNPAGMTELHGKFVGEVGTYLIAPQAKLVNRGSTVSVNGGTPAAIKGASAGQGFDPQPLGDIYLAAPVAARVWLGLGVTAPFGLRDQYKTNYFGRYDSTKTYLRTIDVAPSAAYAVTKWLSVGAGLDIQRADATLQNALPKPTAPGGPSAATDGFFNATGGDWALGFNAGFLLKPSRDLRLGFSYRSAMDHTLKGNAVTDIPGLSYSAQAVSASLKLPDVASLGVAYDASRSLTLLAQANYYGWSRFKEIRLTLANGTQQTIPENFRNTVGFSLGAEWKVAPSWTLRGGAEFDPTPTPGGNRSTAIPDSNRTWLAFGVSYQINDRVGIDMSYAHDLKSSASIDRTKNFSTLSTIADTKGKTEDSSNVVGLAVRFRY